MQIREVVKTARRRRASVGSFSTMDLSRERSGKLMMLYFASLPNCWQDNVKSVSNVFFSFSSFFFQGLLDGCVGAHVPGMQG